MTFITTAMSSHRRPTCLQQELTADLNATTNEADESFEESVTVVTQSEMAACIYCARLFKNGCVKRHQNYCAERI